MTLQPAQGGQRFAPGRATTPDFATMILENLKKAGVQNTRKSERLCFGRLDPYAGTWLHAAGEYTDAIGKTRRVAVSIGLCNRHREVSDLLRAVQQRLYFKRAEFWHRTG